jgi:hypothetical protein
MDLSAIAIAHCISTKQPNHKVGASRERKKERLRHMHASNLILLLLCFVNYSIKHPNFDLITIHTDLKRN